MRISASPLKYLAFVVGLGACFFDPKATGPGELQNPTSMDGGSAGVAGTGGSGTSAGSGAAGQAGDGSIGTSGIGGGTAGASGAGSGAGASGSSGGMSGGMAGSAGAPPPPLLVNGEACSEDALCMSGHCDGICCDKGAECCRAVSDCTTQPGGLGMSCDERTECRGTAGEIQCTPQFKCVTMNGVRNDSACTNRVEANDCGPYPSVFCLGGEAQQGAPACATSCRDSSECDSDAHCDGGVCKPDLANGEPCRTADQCTAGACKNVVNGMGICCGNFGDCCKVPDDCPDSFRVEPTCDRPMSCQGFEVRAECEFNTCRMVRSEAQQACNGVRGNDCGLFQDITCMAGRNNTCRMTCTNVGDCDANAFCNNGRCSEKLDVGETCTSSSQCENENCVNGVCCVSGGDCCSQASQCTRGIDARCNTPDTCQGTRRMPSCSNGVCSYSAQPVDDDSACVATTPMSGGCGLFRNQPCTGMATQMCPTACLMNDASTCDAGAVCQNGTCVMGMSQDPDNSGPGGGGGNSGDGN